MLIIIVLMLEDWMFHSSGYSCTLYNLNCSCDANVVLVLGGLDVS